MELKFELYSGVLVPGAERPRRPRSWVRQFESLAGAPRAYLISGATSKHRKAIAWGCGTFSFGMTPVRDPLQLSMGQLRRCQTWVCPKVQLNVSCCSSPAFKIGIIRLVASR